MSTLFDRQVVVQVGPPDRTRSVSGLRVSFRVVMTATSGPYEAQIRMYNPAPQTVQAVRDPNADLRLLLGYDVPVSVFRGQPVEGGVNVTKQGPDRILDVDALDGGRALRDGHIEGISFAPQTEARDVVDAVIAAAGLPRASVRVPEGLRFARGIALSGPVRTVLNDLATALQARWNLTEGAIDFYPEAEPVRSERGPLLSVANGNLIGSPTLKADEGGNSIEARCLLEPSLRPGKAFRVESQQVSGEYVAVDVTHQGDSGFAEAFYTDVVGRVL